ncbi:hypothetical protein ONS95_010312 [Cadophora gregata]|uniref:uncharacterized protein n=1 Tax=Cadophora gregata TaxID=51156 RepID=UPI0026DC74C9|nr:uncharacterized protein ONS95_010312 [Cadophora gregata]KAK0122048.1 hypothetical protein ONS95_010312 [Cadophora gregata]KAK0127524.1 hypothetical protein ONS96_007058 [Cadophora gregata f. sp. sojae]
MTYLKLSNKENVPLGGTKKGKNVGNAQAGRRFNNGSMFEILADNDGNPKTAKEFNDTPHTEDEVFFKVDHELTGEERKIAQERVDLLNFINKELIYSKIARFVPIPADNEITETEYYHQHEYNGRQIDVGVYHYLGVNNVWTARAFVKFVDSDLSDDEYGITIWSDHAANSSEAKKDRAGFKAVSGTTKFYWTPRWHFVVKYLRERMYAYTQDGSTAIEIIEPEPIKDGQYDVDENDQTEHEDILQVPAGCTGAIIGAKGAKINELKSVSGVKDIKMPEKTEPRPRPRDLVSITFIGRKGAIKKAMGLVEAIVEEWVTAPRPPRAGGNGGGFDQPSAGFAQPEEGSGGGNDSGGGESFPEDNFNTDGAGNNNWADSMNDSGW